MQGLPAIAVRHHRVAPEARQQRHAYPTHLCREKDHWPAALDDAPLGVKVAHAGEDALEHGTVVGVHDLHHSTRSVRVRALEQLKRPASERRYDIEWPGNSTVMTVAEIKVASRWAVQIIESELTVRKEVEADAERKVVPPTSAYAAQSRAKTKPIDLAPPYTTPHSHHALASGSPGFLISVGFQARCFRRTGLHSWPACLRTHTKPMPSIHL